MLICCQRANQVDVGSKLTMGRPRYMYVCMYVYIYIYMFIMCINIYIYVYIYICIYTCIYVGPKPKLLI